MGFEGQILYGATPGSTGAILLENVTDKAYNVDMVKGKTTVRGDGSVVPVETENACVRKLVIDWTMLDDDEDTDLEALLVIAYAGGACAIRTKRAGNDKGFDGDCYITVENGDPLEGEATFKFTATPTRNFGRAPQTYV
jgi:hypothetical protein